MLQQNFSIFLFVSSLSILQETYCCITHEIRDFNMHGKQEKSECVCLKVRFNFYNLSNNGWFNEKMLVKFGVCIALSEQELFRLFTFLSYLNSVRLPMGRMRYTRLLCPSTCVSLLAFDKSIRTFLLTFPSLSHSIPSLHASLSPSSPRTVPSLHSFLILS